MKSRAFLTTGAMMALCLNTVLVPPAFADTIPTPPPAGADSTTLAAMQLQCDTLAAAHGSNWVGDLDESSIVAGATPVSGPTEVAGTRVIDTSTIVGTGVFTPGTTYIQGDPFRIGGSVNMFGDQYASSGSWSDSTYNYTADFTTTYAYSFSCNMTENVHHDATGHHEWTLDPSDPQAQACLAYDKNGLFQGQDQGQCVWVVDSPGGDTPEPRPPEAGTPINQDQTDSLIAFEDHGGPVQANGGPFHIGQVVICISPSKPTPGGTWRTQNGYTGNKCTTDWFKNHAVWGAGTEGSNGTYISVPDYSL